MFSDHYQSLNELWEQKAEPLFWLFILFAACGYCAQYFIFKRLRVLADTAHDLNQAEPSNKNQVVIVKDEISQLAANMQNLRNTIKKQEENNQRYTQQLIDNQNSLERIANFDRLTGLPNRLKFSEIVNSQRQAVGLKYANIAVLMLDMDNFKIVNDAVGHELGNDLIIEVSRRLASLLTKDQIIARIGGDEFAIVIPETYHKIKAPALCRQIFKALSFPIKIKNWPVQLSASIGVAYHSEITTNEEDLITQADIALYRAKIKGRNQYIEYVQEMDVMQKRRLTIASSFEQAIQANELNLLYQPKLDKGGTVIGFEALLRWYSPQLGDVSPAEFIPIAEQLGKINQLTKWVIKRGISDIEYIQKSYWRKLQFAFNLSTLDIFSESTLRAIRHLFKSSDLDLNLIEFEITESAYMHNFREARRAVDEIRKMGCKIALDDFGTGYSSMSYLTQIRADTLKIDKFFINNLFNNENDQKITQAIIQLAHSLNMQVVAEGVENASQSEFLFNSGCDYLQGYYYSPAVSADQIIKTINRLERRDTVVPLSSA
ncbi:putative bifunctional diguanylate cyclase/phosphodiesterase [Gayadomonas joobiniege]|uniref:putative bifunctional diguanylate cyclase/phosphodiesterase n=1 Tax=Gayadomonas joobiniege TaxID=1234606 RepID=UPI00138B0349|nr:EAL domain-containing protein [Gayadomonas joobiniege]